MNLLDETKSWNILCRKVFVKESCPLELEEVGKQIVKNCKGLPLSISVIGGLLANSIMTHEYWEYVARNISTTVNLEDDARCSRILSMSYNHLPIYLKPCFLHLGNFPEDKEIRVSKLIKLWVAEGFLRPPKLESLEEVAENSLKDLVDRNLIFVSKRGYIGNMKCFKIHDLLRDFCLREAQKKKFLCVNMVQNPKDSQDLNSNRRIVLHHQFSNNEYSIQVSRALQAAPLARSLTCNYRLGPRSRAKKPVDFRPRLNYKLLRILDVVDNYPVKDVFQLINSRYIRARFSKRNSGEIPSSICLLWNLQSLVIENDDMIRTAPPEIWEMKQLKHLMISDVELPDPLDSQNDCVLENLQTLSEVLNLRWTDEILGKIPNVKKLKMRYWDSNGISLSSCLNNFVRLDKLQSLTCTFNFVRGTLIENLEFPLSLKKLSLWYNSFRWEDIATKVGTLPNLEKLKLVECYAHGNEWNLVDGKFLSLKYLEISTVKLKYWRAEETHFPCLERLVLRSLSELKEIPSGIGDIESLQLIELVSCSSSSIASAKKILKEQLDNGNESFRVLLSKVPVVVYHKHDSYSNYNDYYDYNEETPQGFSYYHN